MPSIKLRTYYRAVRRATACVKSDAALSQTLETIIRSIARAMQGGASLVLLDSSRKKLVHSYSWGLPKAYLQKGVLDADKSLAEVISGQPVSILDITQDKRVQYPQPAIKAGIASLLGVPVLVGGTAVGSIRVYIKQPTKFTHQDVSFVTTMADLVALAIHAHGVHHKEREAVQPSSERAEDGVMLRQARSVAFAHPSEEEFARILDFYHIEWVYEPRSFLLKGDDDKVTEMFTPDFYLPGLDLYVELTTLRQSLVTEKNRKLRRIRELYPEVKITLLYKRDFDRLLAKYGIGPLAQARGHGVSRVLYSSTQIHERVRGLAEQISADYADRYPVMIGVLRGVFCFMADLIRDISIPLEVEFMAISYYGGGNSEAVRITKDVDLKIAGRYVIMVEDIVDTGMTLNYILHHLRAKGPAGLAVCTLLDKRVRRIIDVPLDYVGFEVPDEFLVGYGLDYKERYRNLPFVGMLVPEEMQSAEDNLRGSE